MMLLTQITKELDTLSPELLELLCAALTGANGEKLSVSAREQDMARLRVNEALTTRSRAARSG